jgi:hypothetical protein
MACAITDQMRVMAKSTESQHRQSKVSSPPTGPIPVGESGAAKNFHKTESAFFVKGMGKLSGIASFAFQHKVRQAVRVLFRNVQHLN